MLLRLPLRPLLATGAHNCKATFALCGTSQEKGRVRACLFTLRACPSPLQVRAEAEPQNQPHHTCHRGQYCNSAAAQVTATMSQWEMSPPGRQVDVSGFAMPPTVDAFFCRAASLLAKQLRPTDSEDVRRSELPETSDIW
jgi:hypothetical protein